MSNDGPEHPATLTGVTLYIMSAGAALVFVKLSPLIAPARRPLPVVGNPTKEADWLTTLTVQFAAATLVAATSNVMPVTSSLQTVTGVNVDKTTGPGSIVIVMSTGSPKQPEELTGVTLYTTSNGPLVALVKISFFNTLNDWFVPVPALPPPTVNNPSGAMLLMFHNAADTLVPFVNN